MESNSRYLIHTQIPDGPLSALSELNDAENASVEVTFDSGLQDKIKEDFKVYEHMLRERTLGEVEYGLIDGTWESGFTYQDLVPRDPFRGFKVSRSKRADVALMKDDGK